MAVAPGLNDFESAKPSLEAIGYVWRGEHGIVGRRYCTLTDQSTGDRRVQLHGFASGHPAVRRHLAFRDHLRANTDLAKAYEEEKIRCAALHPGDSHAYTDCKAAWIKQLDDRILSGR